MTRESKEELEALYGRHPEMERHEHKDPFDVRSSRPASFSAGRQSLSGAVRASTRNRPPPTIKKFSWEDNEEN